MVTAAASSHPPLLEADAHFHQHLGSCSSTHSPSLRSSESEGDGALLALGAGGHAPARRHRLRPAQLSSLWFLLAFGQPSGLTSASCVAFALPPIVYLALCSGRFAAVIF
mmetsp:Transcript_72945/g.201316  ORF Transcript_72945/g.201316 Transcript_72945/m.201316 type:complete len:110 (-) Transcript_72945:54-383(-)